MTLSPLHVRIELDRLRCHEEGAGWGSAEPYLWSAFFKMDGETVVMGDDLFLRGRATVVPTPAGYGHPSDADVHAGEDVGVPPAIGEFQTTLKPIPVPDRVRGPDGVEHVGGVAGIAVVLIEKDCAGSSVVEWDHAALDRFVRRTIDDLIPTVGITSPDAGADVLRDFSRHTQLALASALEAARGGSDHFMRELRSDNQIGHGIWTFTHERLAREKSLSISQRWTNDGDWELVGEVNATSTCPAEAVIDVLGALGVLRDDEVRLATAGAREFRQALGGQLGAWWDLAARNGPAIACILRRNPDLTARSARTLFVELSSAVLRDGPLPDEFIKQTSLLLESFVDAGPRQLRIDAKAALAILPWLQGLAPSQAARVLREQPPTRKLKGVARPTALR
jgi:hypothetical protein